MFFHARLCKFHFVSFAPNGNEWHQIAMNLPIIAK